MPSWTSFSDEIHARHFIVGYQVIVQKRIETHTPSAAIRNGRSEYFGKLAAMVRVGRQPPMVTVRPQAFRLGTV